LCGHVISSGIFQAHKSHANTARKKCRLLFHILVAPVVLNRGEEF